MRFTPRQVDEMTLWELAACADGFNRANGGEETVQPPSNDEFDQMLMRYDEHTAMRQ